MSARQSLTGKTFGSRVVLDDSDEGSHYDARRVMTRCACGKRQRILVSNLRRSDVCDDCSRAARSTQAAARSVLTDEQIRELRAAKDRGEPIKPLARRLGLPYQVAVDAAARRTFATRCA